MKAIILSRMPFNRREFYAAQYFRGPAGHDFEFLRTRLAELGTETPGGVLRSLRSLKWSTDLRYEIGNLDCAIAGKFVGSARHVLSWAEKSI